MTDQIKASRKSVRTWVRQTWVKENFRQAQNWPFLVFTSVLHALKTLPLYLLSKHKVSSLIFKPGRLQRSQRFYRFIFFFFSFHRLRVRNTFFFVLFCRLLRVVFIWNFETDTFKSWHHVFRVNWGLESIFVRLKVIFNFLMRAGDTIEEWNLWTDVMYSQQFESLM